MIITGYAKEPAERWSEERVNEWYARKGWPVGVNYVPSTAINALEMWQEETFDPKTIDRELGWAEDLGFNTMRIFLNDLVWEADPKGFKKRLDKFLDICKKHKMRAIVTFFTNGGKGGAKLGKQPEPVAGLHSPAWMQTPGSEKVNDPNEWPRLERYVKDIMTTFRNDDRILLWCLYNEPENLNRGANTLPLLREVFKWGREVNPSQPLSAPMWRIPGASENLKTNYPIFGFLAENNDVMTFHCYESPEILKACIAALKQFNRPVICHEYLARCQGSTFEGCLPVLKSQNVGAVNFGLVQGKANFHVHWSSKKDAPEPDIWFHDIFRTNGEPYNPTEIDFIKFITGKSKK